MENTLSSEIAASSSCSLSFALPLPRQAAPPTFLRQSASTVPCDETNGVNQSNSAQGPMETDPPPASSSAEQPQLPPKASALPPGNSAMLCPQQLPRLHICSAQWPTLLQVPADVRDDWSDIFTETVTLFVASPSTPTLTRLFFCSKKLLSSVRNEGKARMEAVSRTLRWRFTLWRAGQFAELWERVQKDQADSSTAKTG